MTNKQTVFILMGIPGSGKSTYRNDLNLNYVNQDELGSRKACLEAAEEYLKDGFDIIIDRTNINRSQRSHWIQLAQKYNAEVEVIEFKISPELALQRVLNRKDHPTIKEITPIDKVKEIIYNFSRSYEEVRFTEGITKHTIIHVDNLSCQDDNGV